MSRMFYKAFAFNQDIGAWNTASVTTMRSMFNSVPYFNQDISAWDTSSVTEMDTMFYRAIEFDQDVGDWDMSKVTNVKYMFYKASAFDQDLGLWCFTQNFDQFADQSSCAVSNCANRVRNAQTHCLYHRLVLGGALTLNAGSCPDSGDGDAGEFTDGGGFDSTNEGKDTKKDKKKDKKKKKKDKKKAKEKAAGSCASFRRASACRDAGCEWNNRRDECADWPIHKQTKAKPEAGKSKGA